jgi:hypothetical protein
MAICFGTICFLGLMIVAGQYNLANDPEYDSIAPAISIIAGWLPGLIYSSFCVLVVVLYSRGLVAFKTRNH